MPHLAPFPQVAIILPCFLLVCTDYNASYTPYFYAPLPSAIHFILELKAVWPSEMLVSYHITAWCHNPEDCNQLEPT